MHKWSHYVIDRQIMRGRKAINQILLLELLLITCGRCSWSKQSPVGIVKYFIKLVKHQFIFSIFLYFSSITLLCCSKFSVVSVDSAGQFNSCNNGKYKLCSQQERFCHDVWLNNVSNVQMQQPAITKQKIQNIKYILLSTTIINNSQSILILDNIFPFRKQNKRLYNVMII